MELHSILQAIADSQATQVRYDTANGDRIRRMVSLSGLSGIKGDRGLDGRSGSNGLPGTYAWSEEDDM